MKHTYLLLLLFVSTLTYSQNCIVYTNSDAANITFGPPPETVMATVDVEEGITITDVNLTLNLNHSFLGDLNITLQSPTGTVSNLKNVNTCGGGDNIEDATFDDDGGALEPCTNGVPPGIYMPETPLAVFNGEISQGTWTLSIADAVAGDDGRFLNYTLEICTDEVLSTSRFDLSSISMFPNPANNTVDLNMGTFSQLSAKIYNILGKTVLTEEVSSQNSRIDIANLATGAYLVQLTTQDGQQTTKKLIKR